MNDFLFFRPVAQIRSVGRSNAIGILADSGTIPRVLPEHPAPHTDPHVAAQEELIALPLVERAERDQAERARGNPVRL